MSSQGEPHSPIDFENPGLGYYQTAVRLTVSTQHISFWEFYFSRGWFKCMELNLKTNGQPKSQYMENHFEDPVSGLLIAFTR